MRFGSSKTSSIIADEYGRRWTRTVGNRARTLADVGTLRGCRLSLALVMLGGALYCRIKGTKTKREKGRRMKRVV
jgi:hypothetical protein